MLWLRFATVAAIAIWAGGLLALGGIAAPAIFDVVAAKQVADGRMLSGAVFGEALRRFHLVAYACGAVIALTLGARAVLGPRPRRFAFRAAVAILMLGATLYSGLVLSQQIARVQQEIGAAIPASSLAADDPRRIAFGRFHQQSAALHMVPLLGGFVLLFLELGD